MLYFTLNAIELGPHIRGIALPNNNALILEQFADDTLLFVELSVLEFRIIF